MSSRRTPKIAWAMYDLANTIFSMNVISLYLPLWIASSFEKGEIWFAVTYSISMILVGVASPLLGSLGDRRGHKRLLLWTTIPAILFTFLIGLPASMAAILIVFALANFGYQLSLVSYNSLLTSVADPPERGRVSGLGVALGYVGSFVGMYLVFPFVNGESFTKLSPGLQRVVNALTLELMTSSTGIARSNAFIPTALLFAVFAVPLFLFVREKRENSQVMFNIRDVGSTFREILANRNLRAFYLASFLYLDAVHTVYIVMATYARFAVGLSDAELLKVMSAAIATAVLGSIAYGFFTDRLPLKISVYLVLANWTVALLVTCFATSFVSFLFAAMICGVGLGGVEVVTRVALLGLIGESPPGRFFGFFNLTGKASSVVGPQLWALVLFAATPLGPLRFRLAVGALLILVLLSIVVFRTVRFPKAAGG